jgi:glycosyltransferase involved in cell wall biosynthesis
LKILEALASGLPVVASRVGAEGLLLTPGEDYVRADEDAMADVLVHAIRYPEAIQTMSQRGRQRVLETYDWEVLARKLEAAWQKAVLPS